MSGVLIVDKAEGPSSHDVVRVARRVLGTRAVGHAGTLDPMASGVLVLGFGEGTKLLSHLTAADKTYRATLRLGAETDSLDAHGTVVEELPVPIGLSLEAVKAAALQFMGETLQRAPVISAIKQAGKPLYKRARSGEEVVAPERSVTVHALEIERVEGAEIELRVHSAKGFYVRALARDLARALGTCGHLTKLRRLASGPFELSGAVPFEVLAAAAGGDAAARARVAEKTLPLAAALRGHASLCVTAEGEVDIKHGRPLIPERLVSQNLPAAGTAPIALTNVAGDLLALGRADVDRVLIVRGIHPNK